MGSSKTRPWILGTAILAFVVLAATWLLAVTPKLAQAQETREANDQALARQDQLRSQLATLQEQALRLDEYRAELDTVAVQIPAEARLSEYTRQLDTVALQFAVTIVALNPGEPVTFGEVLGAVPAPAPTETTDGEVAADPATDAAVEDAADATADATTDAETPPAPPAAEPSLPPALLDLVAIPVAVTVLGTYPNVMAFLDAVQVQIPRLFLVVGLSVLSQGESDGTGGRPATAPGDVEMTIEGLLYQYPAEATGPVAVPEGGEEPTEPAPLPSSDRNPFASITG